MSDIGPSHKHLALNQTRLFLNHLCFEPNLIDLVDNIRLAHLLRVEKNLSSFRLETHFSLLYTLKPFQG